jgi:hypothetical protein
MVPNSCGSARASRRSSIALTPAGSKTAPRRKA